LKTKVMQEVENAIVEQTLDALATVDVTPLQRVDLAGALARGLIDALGPYFSTAPAAQPVATPKRVRGPRPPRPSAKQKAAAIAAAMTPPLVPQAPVLAPPIDLQPAPPKFSGPPPAASPFAG